jgi:hypothetical protein
VKVNPVIASTVRLREQGWKLASIGTIPLIIFAVVLLAAGKEPISKIVIVAIFSGVVGVMITAPWWFYVSVIRNVLIINADEDGQIVIQERIGRYLFRTRIWLIKDCRIEPISFMTQKLSNDGIDYRSVDLYLGAKEVKELRTLQERLKRKSAGIQ